MEKLPRGRYPQEFREQAVQRVLDGEAVADNLLGQDFAMARAPNEAWLSDLISILTQEGWFDLLGHKDLFTGEIIGYATGERIAPIRRWSLRREPRAR
jgi:transposase InsO family protein